MIAVISTITGLNNLVEYLLPQIMTFVSIVVFTQTTHKPLLSSYVVLLVTYFGILCQTFGLIFMRGLTYVVNGNVSCNRIQV